ncbi:MAG: hypothetical protein SGILL_005711, partial [Bacillariaceae sp.]
MSSSNNAGSDEQSEQQKRLVLIGGGHAHVQVIKALNHASRPKNMQVTLIDLTSKPTYSGMVPGAVAGIYDQSETIIDLKPLADWAGIDFVQNRVTDIDVNQQEIFTENSSASIPFDAVSIDIGSASRGLNSIPGAR